MTLSKQTLEDFCSQLAAGTPAPGGGAAAAVMGALGAALVAMVAGLTVGREKYASVHEEMLALRQLGQREIGDLLACAQADQAAFVRVMAAYALPKATPEDRATRRRAVQEAFVGAVQVPLSTMKHSIAIMRAALAAAARGNKNALSDAYVGFLAASTAFEGALWSVAMNLPTLDEELRQEVLGDVNRLRAERTELDMAFKNFAGNPIL